MAAQKWHTDIEITLAIAQRAIQDQFPILTPFNEIKCIGEGWDNKFFLVNQQIIFCFPRRQVTLVHGDLYCRLVTEILGNIRKINADLLLE